GFTAKTLKTGYYDVTLSTYSRPTVTSTGYGAAMSYVRRPFRSLSVQADALPIPQMSYAVFGSSVSNSQPVVITTGAVVNSYDSTVSTSPSSVGYSSSAVVWSNNKFNGPS